MTIYTNTMLVVLIIAGLIPVLPQNVAVASAADTMPYVFLPKPDQYEQIDTKAKQIKEERENAFSNPVPGTLLLRYDLAIGQMTISGERDDQKVDKGSFISLEVVNVNPFIYDVSINDELINRHMEHRGKFEELIQEKPVTTTETQLGTKLTTPGDPEVLDALSKLFKSAQLHRELSIFYNMKIVDPYPSMDRLLAEVEAINENITTNLGISPVSGLRILAGASSWFEVVKSRLNDDKSKAALAELFKESERGAQLYTELSQVTYRHRSGLVQVGNFDIVRFKLDIKKEGESVVKQQYDVEVVGGFKLDFSAGLFATWLVDSTYTTEIVEDTTTVPPSTKNLIIAEDTGAFRIGAGVMSHFYWRKPVYHVYPSLSTGGFINFDGSIQALVGLSLLVGTSQRWIVSGGASIGKVSRLSAGLEVGQEWSGSNAVIPTTDHWGVSWFAGISFNFGQEKSVEPATTQ